MHQVTPALDSLIVQVSTWQRDSHELYDYESRSLTQFSQQIGSTLLFFRRGTDVFSVDEKSAEQAMIAMRDVPLPTDYLLHCISFENRFLVSPSERVISGSSVQPKKLWLVVRELGKYTLSEGDVIKLGRFKLRVKQMISDRLGEAVRPDLSFEGGSCGSVAPPEADGMPCRICLLEGSGRDEDPLIEACSCRGSIQYVHLGCLRYWINGRLALAEGAKYTYLFAQLSCELCKSSYPNSVRLSDGISTIPLVPMPETKAPFIILENMMRAEGSGQEMPRGMYVISLAGKNLLRLGRGHESDVRIADVSISRWHATVSFTEDGRFVIEDHNSKFGTLVGMRRPRLLDLTRGARGSEGGQPPPLTVQSGRTVFRFMTPQQHAEFLSNDIPPPQLSNEEDNNI